MYLDFEGKPDVPPIGSALTTLERVLLTLVIYLLLFIAFLLIPPTDQQALKERIEKQMALQQQRQREDSVRFVFVQPRIDTPARRPVRPGADASDKDRNAQTRERAQKPTNALPFSRGNTSEPVEALRTPPAPPPAPSPGQSAEPQHQPAPPGPDGASRGSSSQPVPNSSSGLLVPRGTNSHAPDTTPGTPQTRSGPGLMGSAMRELQRMVRDNSFDNLGGGEGVAGSSIQFDSKGVEFGPWLRRFKEQIERNWFMPEAFYFPSNKGHVVLTFYVTKDGRIESLSIVQGCSISGFNNSSYNAIAASNPTYPLPPQYPDDRMAVRVTFSYNERY
jgi:TonB family protein